MGIKEKILQLLDQEGTKSVSKQQMLKSLYVKKEKRRKFYHTLDEMMKDGIIALSKDNAYTRVKRKHGQAAADRLRTNVKPEATCEENKNTTANLVTGRLVANEKGFGFLISEGEDIFLPPGKLKDAMHGDTVEVRVLSEGEDTGRNVGTVLRVLQRGTEIIVGTFYKNRRSAYVIPSDKRFRDAVRVETGFEKDAKEGQQVVIRLTRWGGHTAGRIEEIIGNEGDKGVSVSCLLREHGIWEAFPKDALKQAKTMPSSISNKDLAGRRDLRNGCIFTIDGAEAKDLDDAVSLEKDRQGNYILGVHIADVSHYVTADSPLDKEAFKRGTSVYPVDRVVPMLPEQLSNGICSLNANVDRLTFSCIMQVDPNGDVLKYEILPSVIHSCERMTYDNVNSIFEGDEALRSRYAQILPSLDMMKELCAILRQRRTKRGSIDFDLDEAYIRLDENGIPYSIEKRTRGISQGVIEEFMLLANETVAAHAAKNEIPFVYRIHERPDEDKLREFNAFAAPFGVTVSQPDNATPKMLQQVIEAVKGKPEEPVVASVLLRSMKKARYTPDNLGHFGLAARNYCHFTSPIRRYPDLVIHRFLKQAASGNIEGLKEFAQKASVRSSEREIAAMEGERAVADYMKAAYMEHHIGEEYDATVSGVTAYGMYLQLENTVEGFIRIGNLEGAFTFDAQNYALSAPGKATYRLGQRLRIRVDNADSKTGRIDFSLVF
ncbi:MAG: ribonuclease R [Christensenellales bacterium]